MPKSTFCDSSEAQCRSGEVRKVGGAVATLPHPSDRRPNSLEMPRTTENTAGPAEPTGVACSLRAIRDLLRNAIFVHRKTVNTIIGTTNFVRSVAIAD